MNHNDTKPRTGKGRTVGAGLLTAILVGGTARAHEGDYAPEDTVTNTIPETARTIIEESNSSGPSTGIIIAGIGVLALAGAAVAVLNLAKSRSAQDPAGTNGTDAA
jgi:hypothetical protein